MQEMSITALGIGGALKTYFVSHGFDCSSRDLIFHFRELIRCDPTIHFGKFPLREEVSRAATILRISVPKSPPV